MSQLQIEKAGDIALHLLRTHFRAFFKTHPAEINRLGLEALTYTPMFRSRARIGFDQIIGPEKIKFDLIKVPTVYFVRSSLH